MLIMADNEEEEEDELDELFIEEREEGEEEEEGEQIAPEELLERHLIEAELLLQHTEEWIKKSQHVQGQEKFANRVRAEARFLQKLKTDHNLLEVAQLRSSNLPWLRAVLETAETVDGVVAVLQVMGTALKTCKQRAEVDVVAYGGRMWIKVKAMSSQRILLVESGNGGFGEKSIAHAAKRVVATAEECPIGRFVPMVVYLFTHGCPLLIETRLRKAGVHVISTTTVSQNGLNLEQLTRIVPQGYGEKSDSINLDITCLLAMISHTSHPMKDGTSRSYSATYLQKQAIDEEQNPVLDRVNQSTQGKTLIVCETAYKKFLSIVAIVAGSEEKQRAAELITKLHCIPDQPSSRALSLPLSRKITPEQVAIFGTADTHGLKTATANGTFVAAARAHGVLFDVELIGARALSEWNVSGATRHNKTK